MFVHHLCTASPPLCSTPSPLYTRTFTDTPCSALPGGWGYLGGWPLLIQRLGICIWLLFVNQWCDCESRRGSPSTPLSLSGCLPLNVAGLSNRHSKLWKHNYTQRPNAWLSCGHMKPVYIWLINTRSTSAPAGSGCFCLCVKPNRGGKTGMFLPDPKSVKTERKPMW